MKGSKFLFLLLLLPAIPVFSAEFIIQIGAGSDSFEDGDVIHAMNDIRILDVHAQHIVHSKLAERNADTLIPTDSLTAFYLERVKQYRFERTGSLTLTRTNLFTGETDEISDVPNKDGERMNIPMFIARKVQSPRHQIFGEMGAEIWYGGNSSFTLTDMNDIWTEIEVKTSFLKANHSDWPFTINETSEYLIFKVDDFDMTERGDLESPLLDDTPDENVLKHRKHNVDWRNDLGLTAKQKSDIESKIGSLDYRFLSVKTRADIITTKTVLSQ